MHICSVEDFEPISTETWTLFQRLKHHHSLCPSSCWGNAWLTSQCHDTISGVSCHRVSVFREIYVMATITQSKLLWNLSSKIQKIHWVKQLPLQNCETQGCFWSSGSSSTSLYHHKPIPAWNVAHTSQLCPLVFTVRKPWCLAGASVLQQLLTPDEQEAKALEHTPEGKHRHCYKTWFMKPNAAIDSFGVNRTTESRATTGFQKVSTVLWDLTKPSCFMGSITVFAVSECIDEGFFLFSSWKQFWLLELDEGCNFQKKGFSVENCRFGLNTSISQIHTLIVTSSKYAFHTRHNKTVELHASGCCGS